MKNIRFLFLLGFFLRSGSGSLILSVFLQILRLSLARPNLDIEFLVKIKR